MDSTERMGMIAPHSPISSHNPSPDGDPYSPGHPYLEGFIPDHLAVSLENSSDEGSTDGLNRENGRH